MGLAKIIWSRVLVFEPSPVPVLAPWQLPTPTGDAWPVPCLDGTHSSPQHPSGVWVRQQLGVLCPGGQPGPYCLWPGPVLWGKDMLLQIEDCQG